ncbi:short chain dehydrogenase [Neolentinus lepideus HHB14362 ss-1]|uniref:Short chain dehydrogenase n=1 Tax=Neolentinus lepideus HHB14362 ss-1 TaxID=1314782 RepID=A0A165VF23_9AGAM|nr:short chain dehydrogenase [Neolentinus lepideus HHB14362 ss-1]
MSKKLVWLVTGTSSGLGRELVLAILARGDQVIATGRSRSFDALAPLKQKGAAVLELDVTAPLEELENIAAAAERIYGRVDVLVNNAGAYTTPGIIEDQTPDETLQQFNINLFGPLNVARAFLPYMRERRSGVVAWMGSVGGCSPIPNSGLYCATKAAMRSISQSLDADLAPFNVRSICFEFGFFRAGLTHPDRVPPLNQRIPAYKEIAENINAMFRDVYATLPGDPTKGVQVLIDVVRGEGGAAEKQVPSRFAVGSDAYQMIRDESAKMIERLEEWRDVVCSTDMDDIVVPTA